MKPPRTDRERAIAEQCWLGIGCLLFWAVLIMGLFKSCALGEEIKLSWKQTEGPYPTIQWRIYRIHPLPRVQIAIADQTHAYVTADVGDKLVITSENQYGESDDSAPWIVRAALATPIARVTVQTSADMQEWEDHQAFDFDEPKGKFFRLKIETP